MEKLIIALLLVLCSCSDSEKSKLVNDFVFKSKDELIQIYGKPSEQGKWTGSEKLVIWRGLTSEEIKVEVFYKTDNFSEAETVRLSNIQLSTFFDSDLGWESGLIDDNKSGLYTEIKGLKGMKKAIYKYNLNVLDIQLDNPNIETFGQVDIVSVRSLVK